MNKMLALLCAGLLAATVPADAQNDTAMNRTDHKTLVVYFSATGTTRAAAERLAEVMQADLFEIVPQQPYTAADLDWRNKSSRSSVEMNDRTSRPAIARRCADLEQYDVVFIGFPIWWDAAPTIVNTFIESHDLAGKRLLPFATSGSSSIRNSASDLKKSYPALKWETGRLLNGASQRDLEAWREETGL